ncbi:RND family efflux transporter MFP subunit [Marinirhabdus gelatinilytica]|uniref:RND family efflux transporter MFP subunit n=2 Tax=Marinirhabdus gelatinilytica TaxID=1703343 RepID=A0A370QJP1_9FLAO|nr:RND family efflux transporter MFP subunit [Marinirhabdus gelatinilytica]
MRKNIFTTQNTPFTGCFIATKNNPIMKQLSLLFFATLLLTSCGNSEPSSVDTIIASGNVEELQQKRNELTTEVQEINAKIKLLDEKLKEVSPDANVPLITSFIAKDTIFNHFVELQGSVETDQNIVVTPEMGGVLTNVYVKEGQRVRKGQTLARVDDGGMSQQLAQLEVQADLAKTTFERQERLWNQKIGSEIQYLQAKSNYEGMQKNINSMKQQLAKATVRAPFSGTIDDIITEQGSVVSPGQTPILRIVSLNDMYISTNVPETYITDVVEGKEVKAFFPVLNKTIDAKVSQTASYINPDNRTFKAEIDVPNKENTIKPNLTARLQINDYTNKNAILIPQSIISENAQGEQYVYVLKEKQENKAVASRVIIETGKTQGDQIEVLSGLENGAELIEEGARSVKDGQTVKIISY